MAIDNTHTKYLKGSDKKAWNDYEKALDAQQKLDNFLGGFNVPELKEGEEYDVPVKGNRNKGK